MSQQVGNKQEKEVWVDLETPDTRERESLLHGNEEERISLKINRFEEKKAEKGKKTKRKERGRSILRGRWFKNLKKRKAKKKRQPKLRRTASMRSTGHSPRFKTRSIMELRNKLRKEDQNGRRRFLTVGLNYECTVFSDFKGCLSYLKKALTSRIDQKDTVGRKSSRIEPFWIDVQSPSKKDMEDIESFFNLHKLTTEDCLDNDSGEKMEMFPNYLFVCVETFDRFVMNKFEELNVIVFKHFVITVHRGYFEEIDFVLKRIQNEIDSGVTNDEEFFEHVHSHHHHIIEEEEDKNPELFDAHQHRHQHDNHHHHFHPHRHFIKKKKKKKKKKEGGEGENEKGSVGQIRFTLPRIPHPSWILYVFLDIMTDMYIPVAEQLLMEVESLDEEVLNEADDDKYTQEIFESIVPSNTTSINQARVSVKPSSLSYRTLKEDNDVVNLYTTTTERLERSKRAGRWQFSQTDLLRKLGVCQKKITRMKKFLSTKQSIVQALSSDKTDRYMSMETLTYIRDVVDHLTQCVVHLESAKEALKQNHSNYMTRVSIDIANSSKKTDAFMGKVELFVALFTPVACVAGIWGMNMLVPWQFTDTNRSTSYFFWILFVSFVASMFTIFCLNPYLVSSTMDKLVLKWSDSKKKEKREREIEMRTFFDSVSDDI